jgi:hypothetical protein
MSRNLTGFLCGFSQQSFQRQTILAFQAAEAVAVDIN